MESKRKFMRVQGQLYCLLGMYGGIASLSKPTDVNNQVVKRGVIWEMQPFQFHQETKSIKILYYRTVRFFKKDVWGRSDFQKLLKRILN